jgi:hypothetical protein
MLKDWNFNTLWDFGVHKPIGLPRLDGQSQQGLIAKPTQV